MSRRNKAIGSLNPLARQIKSIQRVQFPIAGINSTGLKSVNQTINNVDLSKSTIELISEFTGHYIEGGSLLKAFGGVYLSDNNQATIELNVTYYLGGPFTIAATAQIIEYFIKPKSLQNIQGDGTNSQAINPINVNNAVVIPAYFALSGAYLTPNYNPVLSDNNISWFNWDLTSPLNFVPYQRVQIVEF